MYIYIYIRICSPVLGHAPGGTILEMFPRAVSKHGGTNELSPGHNSRNVPPEMFPRAVSKLGRAPGGTFLRTRIRICSPVLGRAPGGTCLRICICICTPVLGHAPGGTIL